VKTHRLRIHGRVQRVGFRESMRIEAERLQVTGWVRNAPDGTVEAVVQGPDDAVKAMIEWAHAGPPLARVERVEISDADGKFGRFEKRAD
jgi:acylphosphatase